MAIDSRGPNDDLLVVTGGTFTEYRGGGGDDRYFVDGTNTVDVSITDGQGTNVLALDDGLVIASAEFLPTAFQLTLNNGTQITVNAADTNFVFQLGGGVTGPDGASDLSYADFAFQFGTTPTAGDGVIPGGTVADDDILCGFGGGAGPCTMDGLGDLLIG